MKLSELLQEAKYAEELKIKKAWKEAELHCKDALKLGSSPIVRGSHNTFGVEMPARVQGDKGKRKSRNTTNYYTVILDKVLGDLGFPLRSKSIICGTYSNKSYAGNYGDLYAVLPYDGVRIGVCPGKDIFDTWITIGGDDSSIDRWNDVFDDADISAKSFTSIVNGIEKQLKSIAAGKDELDSWVKQYLIQFKPGTVEQQISTAYSPKKAGFKLATTKDKKLLTETAPHELWIGGPCIMLPLKEYKKKMKKMAEE